ncbi:hypothetical protein CEUSTIGMA_g1638.t1 [Chlamydomonas eustigma]|uniref:Uncharacterized protein n=1 Tax=Chlamydomonas eustigma TaxID=1157962 RepID=A0A250WTY1_9CHLO|nr:hypothetical protein CEUSTIGMA_g1638.t1 [Chlamydomonas eustigma]|eukprot:GAX74189.1 hypothetical protein CEUSTIGMA_g1638.t1 [Chlamydomonas eustigma]
MRSAYCRKATSSCLGKRVSPRCNVSSNQNPTSLQYVAVATFIAAGVTCLLSIPAYADVDENLSPFQKRQAEAEKRRELMRQTREAAMTKMDANSAPQVAIEERKDDQSDERTELSQKLKSDMQNSKIRLYEEIAAKSAKAPIQEPETSALPFSFPSFSNGSKTMESKPPVAASPSSIDDRQLPPAPITSTGIAIAPASAAPQPAARVIPSPLPETQASKPDPALVKESQVKTGSKRKGPLPLWASELAVIGFYAAMVASLTKYGKQTAGIGDAVSKVINQIAKKAKLV